jgi:hypothetical protein
MYATTRAAGKKIRLNMKYPMKLWPFRAATLAGQNAIAIQTMRARIDQSHHPLAASNTSTSLIGENARAASLV